MTRRTGPALPVALLALLVWTLAWVPPVAAADPVASPDVFVVGVDSTATTLDVLANDQDPDGDPLTITGTTDPTNGGTVVNDGTAVEYTPAAGFHGVDTFQYTVDDGNGGTDVGAVTVTVDDRPVATDDNLTVAEDSGGTVVDVVANDTDPDGDSLAVTAKTSAAHGTVGLSGGQLTYTPAAGYHGSDSFTYTISDGTLTDVGTVHVSVTAVDHAPSAVDDSKTVAEDAATTAIDVLANDTDPDGDDLTITARTNGTKGTVAITGGGSGLTYKPALNATGADTFTYTVSDGVLTDIGTVHITITPVNDPPVASDDNATVAEDSGVTTIDVLANDTDPDNDTLQVTAKTNGTKGIVAIADGGADVTYTPNADANGSDTFTYTVSDGNGGSDVGTAHVTITPVNDPPVAVDDSRTLTEDAGPTAIAVLTNDSDPDGDPLTITDATDGAKGTVAITGGGSGLTYTPAANANGTDEFDYTISDGHLGTATATVHLTITPVNDAPHAVDDTLTVAEDSGATQVNVLANDTDPEGDTLTITGKGNGAKGTVAIVNGGTAVTYTPSLNATGTDTFSYTINDGHGGSDVGSVLVTITAVDDPPVAVDDTATLLEDAGPTTIFVLANDTDVDNAHTDLTVVGMTQGSIGTVAITGGGTAVTYTPNPNANGIDSFTYTVSDGHGGTDIGTVHVTITAVDDAPIATNDNVELAEDSAATFVDVLANDTDVDGDVLTVTAKANGAKGTVVVLPDGSGVTYQPNANANGSDTFTYTVSDGHGGTDIGTVHVTIDPQNDPPVATGDSLHIAEDAGASVVDVLANDTDIDGTDTLAVTGVTQGTRGSVAITGGGVGVSYTPNPDANGSDSFTYTVSDGHGGTDIGTVTVTIDPVNDAPVAHDDVIQVPENAMNNFMLVLVNDTDVDGNELSVATITSAPAHGTLTLSNGALFYTPFHLFNGQDTFTYTATDSHLPSNTATVTITVSGANDPPVARNDPSMTVPEGAGATPLAVLANDSDPDSDPLTIVSRTNGAHGIVTITGGGTGLRYDPTGRYIGTDTFTYTINDGHGLTATAAVRVTVVRDTLAPVVVAPVERFLGQTVGSTTTKVRMSWSGSDAGSGLVRYTLQVSVNGHAYATVTLPHPTSTSTDRSHTTNATYRYRVRATDYEGNTSSWRYSPVFHETRYQESSSAVKYVNSWSATSSSSLLGGHARFTTSTTRRVSFRATVTDLAWVATRTTSSGNVQVWIDGVLASTINLDRSATAYRQLVWARHFDGPAAIHLIELRPIGGGRVDLDAFLILH